MKRIIFLLIGTLLVLACKKGPAIDRSDPYYPITISMFTASHLQQPPRDNKIYQYLKDKLNVSFTWDILVGSFEQKVGVMIAGGDYPDLLHVDGVQFYEAGALIPLCDLIEQYAPRLRAHYAQAWEKMKESDGKIYCLPAFGIQHGRDQSNAYKGPAMWIQKEVLKEFGYPVVKTLDEYFELLIRYQKKYPTINGQPTIGFTYGGELYNLINPPIFLGGFPNDGQGTVDRATHEYKVQLYQDIAKRWYKKFNEANALGLVDRSCFVDTKDQYTSKIASGRVLGFHDQGWQFEQAEESLTSQGLYNRTYAPLPIVFDESIRPHYNSRGTPGLRQGIGISVKAKDPVRIIRFLDDQISEEVQRVLLWGIEGEDYHWDEDGIPYRTQEQRNQQLDNIWRLHNKALIWLGHNPKIQGSFSDGFPTDLSDLYSERLPALKPEDKELFEAYGIKNFQELMDPDPPENSIWFPAWQIHLEIPFGSDIHTVWLRAEALYSKYLPRIVLAPPEQFESLWNEYVGELGKIGLDKYEAFMQQGINKRIEMWSPKE